MSVVARHSYVFGASLLLNSYGRVNSHVVELLRGDNIIRPRDDRCSANSILDALECIVPRGRDAIAEVYVEEVK